MKRHLMIQLRAWRSKPDRKPLILRGVRQTGKTYLLEQFGQQNFARTHVINFEKQPSARALFANDLDPHYLIDELRFLLKTSINISQDLLIFDEIQACPNALTSLKYFCEELPELALASAGSLLGLHLNEGSYPVGKVDMLHLYPMTFSEFLAGIGDSHSASYLQQINVNSKISDVAHQHLWRQFKYYLVTGGLPEVVALFSNHQTNLFETMHEIRNKQESLIKAYYADIAKHAGKVNAMHIDRTWRAVPTQLSSTQDGGTNRFKFKGIIPGINRYLQLVNVIDWLEAAELIIKTPIVATISQPLSAYTKDNTFKLFMFDVGLLGAMSGLDPKIILDYDYGTYKGYFAENFVAQQLLASHHQHIFNWQENRAEVEFLLSHQGSIIPIEVKAGHITQAKSLHKYIEKYRPKQHFVLSANKLNIDLERSAFRAPLYLAERLFEL